MKFTVVGNKIICSPKNIPAGDDDGYRRVVVEFDSHVDRIPPHVAARLAHSEIAELEHFLADRRRIQANPTAKNLLEALPGLLREATQILDSVAHVNSATYKQLRTSTSQMSVALENVKPAREGGVTAVKNMSESDAQKERLEHIKQNF
ncbi:MAG: hypothetical protein ACI915_004644 [Gammaproteobacteria bacterium]|jgi:hypothetical protein